MQSSKPAKRILPDDLPGYKLHPSMITTDLTPPDRVFDVREGFLHVPLDEESSLMTTVHTSYGRYRWLRLPFGITSGPEEFQRRLRAALDGL